MNSLETGQIKKLAKGYTDKQMGGIGYNSTPIEGVGWWSNGSAILFEEYKQHSGKVQMPEPKEATGRQQEQCEAWASGQGTQAFPVEVAKFENSDLRLLRFVTKEGQSAWLDGRYVSALLKPKRAGKGDLTFELVEMSPSAALLRVKNGRLIGMVAQITPKDLGEMEWNFKARQD